MHVVPLPAGYLPTSASQPGSMPPGSGLLHLDVPTSGDARRRGEATDFGLAAVVSHASAKNYSVRGTPFYTAPEQITGRGHPRLSY